MYEQDYVMRIIKEMVRTILKLLFNFDTESPSAELLKDAEEKQTLETLFSMIDKGRINEAENALYDSIENLDKDGLEMALLFYSHLNDMPDDFLEEHDYSRDEIKQGLESITSRYGISGIAEMFLK